MPCQARATTPRTINAIPTSTIPRIGPPMRRSTSRLHQAPRARLDVFGPLPHDVGMRRAIKIYDTTLPENLAMIGDTIAYLRPKMDEVMYDAEHFFDGFRANREYALATLKAAAGAGAHWVVLCDTNGGTLPHDLVAILQVVKREVPARLGIHVHNDAECAVANSLAAVSEGVEQAQGTINWFRDH